MNEKIKLTEGELLEVRTLQDKFQQNIFQLGQNTLRKLEVKDALKFTEDEEVRLNEEFKSIRKVEDELVQKFLQKYGEGSFNPSDGTFSKD